MKKIVKPHKARKSSSSTDVPSFVHGKDQILKSPARLQRRKKNELGEFDTGKDTQSLIYYDSSTGKFTNANDEEVTPLNRIGDDPSQWTYIDSKNRRYTPTQTQVDSGEITQGEAPSTMDNFLSWSNRHYRNPILGAPARYADMVRNGQDPITGVASFVPGVGEAIDLGSAAVDALSGNYGTAAVGGLASLLPFVPYSKARGLYNKISRGIRKLNMSDADFLRRASYNDPDDIRVIAYDISKYPVAPTKDRRQQFLKNFKSQQWPLDTPYYAEVLNDVYGKEASKLMRDNPQYGDFIINNRQRNRILDPLDPKTVSEFLDKESKSVRGVYAKSPELAQRYVTLHGPEIAKVKKGGDSLLTNGGLYSSNSDQIANTFKNTIGNDSDNFGYIATIRQDFGINPNDPIEKQLRDHRNSILNQDASGLGILEAKDVYPNYKFVEDDYGKGIERASIPDYNTPVSKGADIINMSEFKDAADARGRWQLKNQPYAPNQELFTRHTLNSRSDFIKYAKQFLAHAKSYEVDEDKFKSAVKTLTSQEEKRRNLTNKLDSRRSRFKQIRNGSIGLGVIGGLGYGGKQLYDLFAEEMASRKQQNSQNDNTYNDGKDNHKYYDYIITQSMLGNPTAKRMTGEDNRYIPAFGQGDRSNLVMSSYGNYATPSVMNIGGELMYVPNPWEVFPEWMVQNQSFRFNNPNDAIDFAENYKYSSLAFPEFFGYSSVNYNKGKDSGIHIKKKNRGKFTALKKRTGKSASWFKEHGTPAQKKMAVFALNARKWKH